MKINKVLLEREEIKKIEQDKEMKETMKNSKKEEEIKNIEDKEEEKRNIKESTYNKKMSFSKFSYDIKKSLLAECMLSIYKKSLGVNLESNYKTSIGVNLINSYIEEQGVDNLLIKTKYNSILLSEINRIVNKYHKLIIESVNSDEPESFKFNTEIKDEFFEELRGEDFDEVSDAIKGRVSETIEEFIQSNINNKIDIEEVINQTQDKINSVKGNTEESQEIKESYNREAKQKIEKIKSNKTTIFESIVHNITKSSLTNEAIKEVYNDNNKLNMDKIIESSEMIYTFLEMLNSSKFENVDKYYIESFINSLK